MKNQQNSDHQMFSNMVKISKAFDELWLFRYQELMFNRTLKEQQVFLVEANGQEWYDKLLKQKNVTKKLEFCKINYKCWKKQLLQYCEILVKGATLPQPKEFNRGANAIVNIADIFDDNMDKKVAIIKAIQRIVELYPNSGYNPEQDEFFQEKIFDGSLLMGGWAIVDLREAQVIAEENYQLQVQAAGV